MSDHPRAKANRSSTYLGLGLGCIAAVFGLLHPQEWKLWGGFLVASGFFLQLDGLVQFSGVVVQGIRAFFGKGE